MGQWRGFRLHFLGNGAAFAGIQTKGFGQVKQVLHCDVAAFAVDGGRMLAAHAICPSEAIGRGELPTCLAISCSLPRGARPLDDGGFLAAAVIWQLAFRTFRTAL